MELCALEEDWEGHYYPLIKKHPINMPQRHNVTELIIQHYHLHEGHIGLKQVLAAIRKSFWIIHGPNEVRKQKKGCMNCKKRFAKPGELLQVIRSSHLLVWIILAQS